MSIPARAAATPTMYVLKRRKNCARACLIESLVQESPNSMAKAWRELQVGRASFSVPMRSKPEALPQRGATSHDRQVRDGSSTDVSALYARRPLDPQEQARRRASVRSEKGHKPTSHVCRPASFGWSQRDLDAACACQADLQDDGWRRMQPEKKPHGARCSRCCRRWRIGSLRGIGGLG